MKRIILTALVIGITLFTVGCSATPNDDDPGVKACLAKGGIPIGDAWTGALSKCEALPHTP